MLTIQEIKQFIDEDKTSNKKRFARTGVKYYEADHDINEYRMFYYNADGELVEDTTRTNIKINHPFFTELIDQCAQYMLSGKDEIVKSDIPELQERLNEYFDDDFKMELQDLITYTKVEGFSYLYRYMDENYKSKFKFADGLGIVEVDGKYTNDGKNYVIYYYVDKIEKDRIIERIQVWDESNVYYFKAENNTIEEDTDVELNPRPHVIYQEGDKKYYDTFGNIPFYRLDNNRKQFSDLKTIKEIIDDYDLHACSLTNDLQDFNSAIYLVRGYEGSDLGELQTNLKTKKIIGVGENGGLDVKTIDIPYEARKIKLELDEKNIYRFGMGFNSAQLGDGNITNIVIKSRYALLDLKCNKMEMNLKRTLKDVVQCVLDEINKEDNTDYQFKDIYFNFEREVMTNATDNAQIELIEAQTEQVKITTLLNVATKFDEETLMQSICDVLDIDYEAIKDKLPTDEMDLNQASEDLMNIPTEDEEETPFE